MPPSASDTFDAAVHEPVERDGGTGPAPAGKVTVWPRREIVLRVLSSLAALPIVVGALWGGGLWFAGLVSLAAGIATHEYLRLVHPRPRALRVLAIVTSAGLPLLAVSGARDSLGLGFMALIVASLAAWIVHLRGDNAAAEHGMGHLLVSILLPAGGLTALALLRVAPSGLGWVVVILAATWGNDTLSFFVGKSLGRHKLLPQVSPNKTWEGFAGGCIGSLLATVAFGKLLVPGLTAVDIIVVTAITSIVGPLGDLSKSMVKRAHRVKDFGTVLPGHGGILDRIDALVFNAPLILLWVHWTRPLLA